MTELPPGSIEDRLQAIQKRISLAARASGRSEDRIRLIAATKNVPVERMREAIAAGLRYAGENRLQEAIPKIHALQGEPIRWHFIGQLQRRKVRSVVGSFELIHSVDSLELAREIDHRAGAASLKQDVLLEINIGDEASKTGFSSATLQAALGPLNDMRNISVRGLMAIPPPVDEPEQARPYFRRLRELGEQIAKHGYSAIRMDELSMGMSHDFTIAIEEGATMVRIGTALFGVRRG